MIIEPINVQSSGDTTDAVPIPEDFNRLAVTVSFNSTQYPLGGTASIRFDIALDEAPLGTHNPHWVELLDGGGSPYSVAPGAQVIDLDVEGYRFVRARVQSVASAGDPGTEVKFDFYRKSAS